MSKEIKFYKYQGAGNDFVLIDNRNSAFNAKDNDLIKHLCDRRFGIGGDGLMLLQDTKNFDFEMVYYNADGNEGTMCGNGGRCIVAFARDLDIIQNKTAFLAVDGPHDADIHDNQVHLGMIPVNEHHRDGEAYVMNTGSPHFVKFVEGLNDINMFKEGYAIRNNPTYIEKGINVNFIEKEGEGYFVRTFERGVEDETYACGTGAVASAMSVALKEGKDGDFNIPIRVIGGQLQISFHKKGSSFSNVFLTGPALQVFQGAIKLS
ncbi:diaminopimelate epimerase [Sphingobacterium sp. DK4209]|uniref:Diaminopimelate epimerase n=1 Tax=Sphingobacterium zhuxiongii TaxID=2662364 RepID=A0A5Q0Q6P5_9SPHI|nr:MULTISPECIES: diaminopimelate epimerase [unclassified Sphingobacterium]MVZ66368.1 diaminopimelate epimerase [Sphingobacterium sp. DK4209]QGA25143.1 diaminopimelate epimerase [Sphingobacterium sp. dk4302]